MKGILQETKKHNLFSKEMRLSLKGKMNSPRDRFLPPKEMAVERPTPPRGRFTSPRENNVGRFKECSSRNQAFSPRGKFTPPNDKVVGKVLVQEGKFPRAGSCNRVVSLSKKRFLPKNRITCPNGRFFSLREKIADNFTSPRELAGKGHVPLVKHVFPGGGPSSPRYRMMSPKDKFNSLLQKIWWETNMFQGRGL